MQRLPAAVRDGYTGAFTDALSTVFLVGAAIVVVAFLLSWLIEERPLRQTVETAGVGEAFASPTSGDSLRELTRELSRLVGRERTRRSSSAPSTPPDVDLPVGAAWLLVQGEEGSRSGDREAIAARIARSTPRGCGRSSTCSRGAASSTATRLTAAGDATAERLLDARRECLDRAGRRLEP